MTTELASLRQQVARLREALEPFAISDRALGNELGPFRFETGRGYRVILRDEYAAFLRRSIQTAMNDDCSPLGTALRTRHCDRLDAMSAASEFLDSLKDEVE